MEYKRLSELRPTKNWFGLPRTPDRLVKLEDLYGVEIVVFDFLKATIRGEEKFVVKFGYMDNPENYKLFITRSGVIMDRLERDKKLMPFAATFKRYKNYIIYE